MFQVIRKPYEAHGFVLERLIYWDLPKSLEFKVGDIIQECNSTPEDEFLVLEIKDKEIECLDINLKIKRYFYAESCRLSEKEIQRRKKAVILKKKQEEYQKKQDRKKEKSLRILDKLKKAEDKKNKKFSFKKKKELIIKFV